MGTFIFGTGVTLCEFWWELGTEPYIIYRKLSLCAKYYLCSKLYPSVPRYHSSKYVISSVYMKNDINWYWYWEPCINNTLQLQWVQMCVSFLHINIFPIYYFCLLIENAQEISVFRIKLLLSISHEKLWRIFPILNNEVF